MLAISSQNRAGQQNGGMASLKESGDLEYNADVVLTGGGLVAVLANRCLAPFFRQPTFQIFAVLHDPGCAGAEG